MAGIYSRDRIVEEARKAVAAGSRANPYPAESPAANEFHAAFLDALAQAKFVRNGSDKNTCTR
ncbi:MAG: hypothetical protein ACKO0Z_01010 [Betaproteobacteria bacterium]